MAWKGTGRGQAGDTSWLGKNGVGWSGCHATPGQGDLSHLLGPRRSEAPALGMEPSWGSGLHNSRGTTIPRVHQEELGHMEVRRGQPSEAPERNGRAVLRAHASLGQSVRRLERDDGAPAPSSSNPSSRLFSGHLGAVLFWCLHL